MPRYSLRKLCLTIALPFLASSAAFSFEVPSTFPSVTTLGERTVPTPHGISPAMKEIVEERKIPPHIPVPNTPEAWLEYQTLFDAPGEEAGRQAAKSLGASYEIGETAGVRTYTVTPKKLSDRFADRVFVHLHGGAFVFGGRDSVLREAVWLADGLGVKVVSVDYRRPPLDPFPAALDDAVAVWREITAHQPANKTALFGTSAGGNLTLATTLRLKELDLPLPGALFAGTPATDLENTSDTWLTLQGLDPLGRRDGLISGTFELYAAGHGLSDPLLSPIYGNLEDFPPTILISGTRDLLLSDTVRMHRALRSNGIVADLHVYDGQAHGDYIQRFPKEVPESEDALRELFEFFDRHLK